MIDRRSRWQDRLGDEVVCVVCGETRDSTEVDRMLWCEGCRQRARARAGRVGWRVGLAVAALLVVYIWLVVQPSRMIAGAWIATVVAAGWLGSKIGREIAYGVYRSREIPVAAPEPEAEAGGEPREP